MVKSPNLSEYNEKRDPYEHVQIVNDLLNYFSVGKASKCRLFMLNMVSPAKLCSTFFRMGVLNLGQIFVKDSLLTLPPRKGIR